MRGTAGRLTKEAIRRMLADEATARRLGRGLAALQHGRERLDRATELALRALGIAGRDDWRRLSRRLGGTKRRLREADERMRRLEGEPPENRAERRRSVVDR